MNAIILASGQELVTGQTVDTNSAYLSRCLAERGIAVIAHVTVGDDRSAIAQAIRDACNRADLVLLTGGLGPTEDDLSRQALADVMGCDLALDTACLRQIEEFFHARRRPMNPSNRIQAMIPAKAEALPNAIGTAPGIYARVGRCDVYVMPGVPSEMEWMFQNAILPRLPQCPGIITHRILHTFGEGESDIGAKIADLMKRGSNPLVGTTVAAGMVSIRIITAAATTEQARAQSDAMAAEISRRLGKLVIGEDTHTLPVVVGDLLRKRRQTLAVAESCTGGLLGQLITAVSGSSDYFTGGVVSYANAVKESLLDVPRELLVRHGAVSEPVAEAMAKGCRQRLGTDWALSVTGIAGPTGGTAEKPVGLVFISLASRDTTCVHRLMLPGTRDIVRLRSALSALNFLRLALLEP